jgi:hypothetical protein
MSVHFIFQMIVLIISLIGEREQNLNGGGIIFFEDFEGAYPLKSAHALEVGDWSYAMQFVENPVYQGKKAVRFEIRPDQPLIKRGIRSEVSVIKEIHENEMWYSFAVYFPTEGFEYDSEREVICQWYQNGSPSTSLRGRKDHLWLDTGNNPEGRKPYDLGEIKKDSWTEIVFHIVHSNGVNGLIEVWINGKIGLKIEGGNMYDDILPRWKLGIYKTSFLTKKSEVDRRFLYFDNIKVGNSTATYEKMIPFIRY